MQTIEALQIGTLAKPYSVPVQIGYREAVRVECNSADVGGVLYSEYALGLYVGWTGSDLTKVTPLEEDSTRLSSLVSDLSVGCGMSREANQAQLLALGESMAAAVAAQIAGTQQDHLRAAGQHMPELLGLTADLCGQVSEVLERSRGQDGQYAAASLRLLRQVGSDLSAVAQVAAGIVRGETPGGAASWAAGREALAARGDDRPRSYRLCGRIFPLISIVWRRE